MQSIGNVLASALSENYINYFNFSGRSYQVIPQCIVTRRLNTDQLLNYYITTADGTSVPLSTIASIQTMVVPESINHFQQLNSATISACTCARITIGTSHYKPCKTLPKKYYHKVIPLIMPANLDNFIQEGTALLSLSSLHLLLFFFTLAALFESFRDPLIVLISVPMSICGAMIFISLRRWWGSLNIYTEVGLVTLIGLISKHGILIVQFANDLQKEGKNKREAIEMAAAHSFTSYFNDDGAMVLGVVPFIFATGAGAVSRFNIGFVIASGISIGTLFTLFVVPAMYMLLAKYTMLNQAKKYWMLCQKMQFNLKI